MEEQNNNMAPQGQNQVPAAPPQQYAQTAPPQYAPQAPAQYAPMGGPGQSAELFAQLRTIANAGNWFYWLAGLSIANTLMVMFKSTWHFFFGLGATQVVDALIHEYGQRAALIGLPINLFIAAIYVVLGYCACRRMKWAFIVGLVIYSLDALLFIVARDFLGLAFHGWVIFRMAAGIKAVTAAAQIELRQRVMQMQSNIPN